MTYPRSQIAPPDEAGFFHVVSRCVRRAFLCGTDRYSGRCFEHRRQWIEDRIRFLAESFAVSIYSYAVMSNHFHIVLSTDPQEAQLWSDEEVADRWLRVFPGALSRTTDKKQRERIAYALIADPKRHQQIRARLGSLSWFMRALNEPIARMANKEDGCSGRFWEGRFKCQALLEEQAVVSAMAYVDLNPVRAKMADTLEHSDHTSIQARLSERASDPPNTKSELINRPLKPVAGLDANALLGMSESSYLDLVQWTGEQTHPLKRGKLKAPARKYPPDILWSLAKHPKQWLRRVQGTESRYYRAIGSAEALMAKAAEIGQRWMKGVSGERARLLLRQQTE
ncbi:transposase [Wenzhouxiangella marina]|uniref:Transposase n=2 Tax=Wenzhouxiangella marina TaxID=1579979 RepID=A0A0K0XY55_9GAMM|nr:transposase [Wenzhouxiangella marina]AKS42556.1 transposase [Wenzhouxiangella marina]